MEPMKIKRRHTKIIGLASKFSVFMRRADRCNLHNNKSNYKYDNDPHSLLKLELIILSF